MWAAVKAYLCKSKTRGETPVRTNLDEKTSLVLVLVFPLFWIHPDFWFCLQFWKNWWPVYPVLGTLLLTLICGGQLPVGVDLLMVKFREISTQPRACLWCKLMLGRAWFVCIIKVGKTGYHFMKLGWFAASYEDIGLNTLGTKEKWKKILAPAFPPHPKT
jgi:hypothetical protein